MAISPAGPAGSPTRLQDGLRAALSLVVLWLVFQGLTPDLFAPALGPLLPWEWISGALVLAVGFAFLRAEGRSVASLGLRLDRAWAKGFAAGVGLGGAIMLACAAMLLVTGTGRFEWNPSASAASLARGAWLYLAVAFNEELIYRGYAFQRAVSGLGLLGAQLLFALLFAYGHWGNPGMAGPTRAWASLNIALAALLLGLGWARTRSLASPMGLHFGWNWVQGCFLGFGVSGTSEGPGLLRPILRGPAWIHGGAFGLEAGAPCALVVTLALFLLARRRPHPGDPPCPAPSSLPAPPAASDAP